MATIPPTIQRATSTSIDLAAFGRCLSETFAGRAVPAFEVRAAKAVLAGEERALGTALLLHGGGWKMVGPATLQSMERDVARWQMRGFVTVNADYRAGGASVEDALAFHDAIRGWRGTSEPLGIVGLSAGGHLGLMTAAERPGSVSFVVGQGAPTDLAALGTTQESSDVLALAREAFGSSREELAAASPLARASDIDSEVLLATSSADRHVPAATQLEPFVATRPDRTHGLVLGGGTHEFIHAGVEPREIGRLSDAEDELLARVLSAHGAR